MVSLLPIRIVLLPGGTQSRIEVTLSGYATRGRIASLVYWSSQSVQGSIVTDEVVDVDRRVVGASESQDGTAQGKVLVHIHLGKVAIVLTVKEV